MVKFLPVMPLEDWNRGGEPAFGTGMSAFHVDLPWPDPRQHAANHHKARAP